MKNVLILTLSCSLDPWDKMINTAINTWDSFEVKGTESIFYLGEPVKENTNKIIYLPVKESYASMGEKLLQALSWCLKNKDFDYIARNNISSYVNKLQLIDYIQTLPEKDVFAGIEIASGFQNYKERWMWGAGNFILSRDVVQTVVDSKSIWRHDLMEDVALSYVINKLNIPYTAGMMASINKLEDRWLCVCYGKGENFEFKDFGDIKNKSTHFFYRVKQDLKRHIDAQIMQELFKNLRQ